MIRLYWDIGHLVLQRQESKGWGASVIPRLARDIRNDLPEVKGFSERNIGYMIQFAREYVILPQPGAKLLAGPKGSILQQPAAKLRPVSGRSKLRRPAEELPAAEQFPILQQPAAILPGGAAEEIMPQLAAQLPWFHNVLLIEKVKDRRARFWYMQQTLKSGWSRNVLAMMINSAAHRRQGRAITNFASQLPPERSDLAIEALKDPYIFDFLTLEEPFHERELETQLLRHVEKFLLELGQGFAFVGRQYHVIVGEDDFYVDLDPTCIHFAVRSRQAPSLVLRT